MVRHKASNNRIFRSQFGFIPAKSVVKVLKYRFEPYWLLNDKYIQAKMTPQEAQEILNSNSEGKVYSLEEANAYLELCSKLAIILTEQSSKSIKKSTHE